MTKEDFLYKLAKITNEVGEDKEYLWERDIIYSTKELTFEQFLQILYLYREDIANSIKTDDIDFNYFYAGEGNVLKKIIAFAERVKSFKN